MRKRDRSVACLLVVDMTPSNMRGITFGASGLDGMVATINVLTKRFGYRFQHILFSRLENGLDKEPFVRGLEITDDEAIVGRADRGDFAWVTALVQQRGISALFLAGAPLEHTVLQVAKEASKLGVAVYILLDATAPADAQKVAAAKEELTKGGVTLLDTFSM